MKRPNDLFDREREVPSRIDGTSDRLFANGLCLPSGSALTDGDQDRVIDVVRETVGDGT